MTRRSTATGLTVIGTVIVGIFGGAFIALRPTDATLAVIASALFSLAVATAVRLSATPASVAVLLAWIGILAPFVVPQRTSRAAIEAGAISVQTITESAISALCFLAALLIARPRIVPLRGREWFLALYLVATAASFAWSSYPNASFLKALQLTGAYALLLCLVRLNSPAALIRQLALVVHGSLLGSLIGLAVNPVGALHYPGASDSAGPRLHGTLPAIGFNILGLVAVVGILLLIANLGPAFLHGFTTRCVLGMSYFVIIVLTHNRTSLVLLLVGVVTLFSLSRRLRNSFVIAAPFAIAFLIAVYLSYTPQLTTYVYRGQTGAEFASLTGRVPLWTAALASWKESPIVGHGYYTAHRLGSFADRFRDIELVNIDNAWVETLLDVGLVGLVPLFLFTLLGTRSAWSRRSLSQPYGPFVAATILVCLVSSVVNPSLQSMTFSLIIIGLLLLLPTERHRAVV